MADGIEVGRGYIAISASAKGAVRQVEREFGGAMPKVGDKAGKGLSGGFLAAAGKIAGPLAALFAADKIKDFFVDANAEARESQKVGRQTVQVVKSTGGAAKITAKQVGDLATAISNKTGIDDEQIQSGENLLLTFTNVRNEVGKGNDIFNQATRSVTDMSVALGQDTKSSAIQLGKALNDPIKGITALSRVGVSFTGEQKKQIKTLVEHGHRLEAQKIILGELRKEFGGSAAATATWGQKSAVAFGNLKEQVGTALLPVMDRMFKALATQWIPFLSHLVSMVDKNAGPAFKRLGDFIGPLAETVRLFIGTLTGKGADVDLPWMNKVIDIASMVSSVFAAVKSVVGPILKALGDSVRTNLAQAVPLVRNIGSALVAAGPTIRNVFQALGAVLVNYVIPAITTLRGLVIAFATQVLPVIVAGFRQVAAFIGTQVVPRFVGIAGAVRDMAAVVLPIVRQIAEAILREWPKIQPVVSEIFQTIGGIITNVMDFIRDRIQSITKVIQFIWSRWGTQITTIVVSVFRTVANVIGGAMKIVGGVVKVVLGLMQGDWRKAGQGIKQIVDGLKQILVAVFNNIRTQLQTILGGLLSNLLGKWTGFLSWTSGKLRTGLAKIRDFVLTPVRAARDALKGILDAISGKFSSAVTAIGRAWDGLKEKAKAPVRFVVNTVLENGILAAFRKIAGLVGMGTGNFHVALPRGFSSGGYTGNIDPSRAAGVVHGKEYVFDAKSVAKIGGPAVLDAWRAAIQAGKLSKPGDFGIPGYGIGGYVKALSFARKQVGKPYIFGSAGPAGFDCSGFMAAIQNVIEGKSPYRRRYSTPAFHGDSAQGFTRGKKALFMVGVNPAPGKTGHMAGTLLGTNVESAGGVGVRMGGSARGYNDPMFSWRGGMGPGFSGNVGGVLQFIKAGFDSFKEWLSSLMKGPLAKLSSIGGGAFGDMIARIPGMVADGLKAKAASFDTGGYLQPGYSVAYNGTGRPEPVGHHLAPSVTIHQTFPASMSPQVAAAASSGRVVSSLRARGIG